MLLAILKAALLRRWFDHMRELKPLVYVTYNGDFFDWPFLDARASVHFMSMRDELGFHKEGEEYCSSYASHLDCIYWVKRDSYLPQGSHGLKVRVIVSISHDCCTPILTVAVGSIR